MRERTQRREKRINKFVAGKSIECSMIITCLRERIWEIRRERNIALKVRTKNTQNWTKKTKKNSNNNANNEWMISSVVLVFSQFVCASAWSKEDEHTRTAFSMQGELSFLRSDFCEFSWSVDIEASTSAFSIRLRAPKINLSFSDFTKSKYHHRDLTEIFSETKSQFKQWIKSVNWS